MPESTRGSDGSAIRAFQFPGHTSRTLSGIPTDCVICPWVPRLGMREGKPFVAYFELKFTYAGCPVHGNL